ncbi:MAG: PQQ-binding-like beta-propeller repeat protein [Candidatus Brocadiaceae bacterium]|nr:PQQ-binding-like beta-propeller repeat protein [Candidatus Brocadiaceae bacterium]
MCGLYARSRESGLRRVCGLIVLAAAAVGASVGECVDWPQFRGPGRDGKSPETGLLRQWPDGGPGLLWAVDGLGIGFSSCAVADGMVYTTGMEDGVGYICAVDTEGRPIWKMPYGAEWTGQHPGSRTTPTVDGALLYVMTAYGRVGCFDAKTGEEKWAVDTAQTFGARTLTWGLAESLLIDGDRVICTPGGPDATMVALDKMTGRTVWVSTGLSDKAGYCSPILIERGGRRIICTLTGSAVVGIDADTGRLLWRSERSVPYDIHATAPEYSNGRLYVTSGYGGVRGQMFELSPDGSQIALRWTDSNLDVQHGGTILHQERVYGSSDRNRPGRWLCLDIAAGQVLAETPGVGKGSLSFADGMIYAYGERGGVVGLVNPDPREYGLVSSFRITRGAGQHWAHPAIANGRLYIRRGDVLMAFDIRAR